MMGGDWDKEQFQAEVEAHDDIIAHTAMQRMQLATGSQSRGSNEPPAHEPLATGSKTTLTGPRVRHQLEAAFGNLEGNFFATIGYSRFRDPKGQATDGNGWVMFGAGCKTMDRSHAQLHGLLHG